MRTLTQGPHSVRNEEVDIFTILGFNCHPCLGGAVLPLLRSEGVVLWETCQPSITWPPVLLGLLPEHTFQVSQMRCYLFSTVARLVQVVPRDGSHSRQVCQSLYWKASSSIARANEMQFITLKYHPYTTSSNRMISSLYHPYKLKHTQHDFHVQLEQVASIGQTSSSKKATSTSPGM